MREKTTRIGALDCTLVGEPASAALVVILLHGYGMRAGALSPFAHSLGVKDALFVFPQGPCAVPEGGFAWWPREGARSCLASHATNASAAPRDLAEHYPAGRGKARAALAKLLRELRGAAPGAQRLLLAGFSQGGMLACDALLMREVEADALAMLSASRLAFDEWFARRERLRGLPVFVSHGRADTDLSFDAGERLRSFLDDAGASVTWVPFGSGHEIPLTVWRQFRGFLGGLFNPTRSALRGAESARGRSKPGDPAGGAGRARIQAA